MDNIIIIASIAIAVCLAIIGLCYFFKLEKGKQIKIITEWLLIAVVKAEKELGGGTGQLKLRFVYDLFLEKFKWVSHLISFEQFSLLVDGALVLMREMISNNTQVERYIINKEM